MMCRRLVQPVYISGLSVNVTYAEKHASNFPVQKYFYGCLQTSVQKERQYFCDVYSLIMYLCCRLKVQKVHYFAAELSSGQVQTERIPMCNKQEAFVIVLVNYNV